MPNEAINDPKVFFEELGGLHDARIEKFSLDFKKKLLWVSIDDLNSNFLDLPEYRGFRPADIYFVGVKVTDIDTQVFRDVFSIYDIKLANDDGGYQVKIECFPGGYFEFWCNAIEVDQGDIRLDR